MKWFLTIVALFSGSLFLALEAIILLYAIHNRHFAYYYGLIGAASLLCIVLARYLNRKNPPKSQGIRILQTFTHGLTVLIVICGLSILLVNYWLNESI